MLTLSTNENGDIFLGADGNLATSRDLAALGQCCETAIAAQRGEMVYAIDQGMPMRLTAFDNYDPNGFEAAARSILLGIPGVLQVLAFNVEKVANTLNYIALISTIYGTAAING